MSAAMRLITGASLLPMCSSCMSERGMPISAIASGGEPGMLTGMTSCRQSCEAHGQLLAVPTHSPAGIM